MGKAARWFRALFGGKKRWGFLKSFREKEKPPPERKWLPPPPPPPSYRDVILDEDGQSKRAIAVAAATAAVAEAAVAAAQAAAVVVRLTRSGRTAAVTAEEGTKREERAAVKIQAAFRGYLARRALRALKALVKLQALVRGNIVRKQAAETLKCMQALVRVQARARARRTLCPEATRSRSGKSSRSNAGPCTPDKIRSRSLKRNSPKQGGGTEAVHSGRDHSANWNWLDQWMEERYWDSREASKTMDDEKNAKILEVDTGKPHFNLRRQSSHNHINHPPCSSSTVNSDQIGQSLSSTLASVPSPPVSRRQSMSPMLRFPSIESGESPQFYSAASRPGRSRRGPFTPVKSECARSLFNGYTDYPNYMVNTESSMAKVRSQSAPRQRSELGKLGSARRLSVPGSTRQSAASKAYPFSGKLERLGGNN
ncbi:hypothetical protein KSP40_PGU005738 [Platanthera guangdongensis]|uniref:DUF4005 domain-containing protein n=1 Tax=Platanthera guangdongensis TaxID=2320717 RepID=A0ABR2LP74_9ASPA